MCAGPMVRASGEHRSRRGSLPPSPVLAGGFGRPGRGGLGRRHTREIRPHNARPRGWTGLANGRAGDREGRRDRKTIRFSPVPRCDTRRERVMRPPMGTASSPCEGCERCDGSSKAPLTAGCGSAGREAKTVTGSRTGRGRGPVGRRLWTKPQRSEQVPARRGRRMFSGATSGTAPRGRKNLSDRKGRSERFFPIGMPHRLTRGAPRGPARRDAGSASGRANGGAKETAVIAASRPSGGRQTKRR